MRARWFIVTAILQQSCAFISDSREQARLDPDQDGVLWPDDCDDHDASVGEAQRWWPDEDGDGFGTGEGQLLCTPPAGSAEAGGDCDDRDPAVNPQAEEVCDQTDNNCDGDIDEGAEPSPWYADQDQDGYGDPEDAVTACQAPDARVADGTDCDDGDPDIHPDAAERCDGVDQDCDGSVDEDATDAPTWYLDGDGDGYGADAVRACDQPSGTVATGGDCDDTDASWWPGSGEWAVPGDFDTVQQAVDHACDGDTVQVGAGIHDGDVSWLGKALQIEGEGVALTLLRGSGTGPVLQASDVPGGAIRGLSITGGVAANGGGISLTEVQDFTISEVSIRDCEATEDGGGIYVDGAARLSLDDVLLAGNIAGSQGGGVALRDGASDGEAVIAVRATGNSAGGLGGGLWASTHGQLTLQDCTLGANRAGWYGGAWVEGIDQATVEIYDDAVISNHASHTGGGVGLSVSGDTVLTVDQLQVGQNHAEGTRNGLVLRAAGGSVTASRLDVRGNQGASGHAAVHVQASEGASVLLSASLAAGNAGLGFALVSDGATIEASNLAAVGNLGTGVQIQASEPGEIVLTNSAMTHNGGSGVQSHGAAPPQARYNDVWGNGYADWTGTDDPTGTDGNTSTDPDFIALSTGGRSALWDLHLASGSALRDAGEGHDPDGGPADIGAHGGPMATAGWYDDADSDGLYDGWQAAHGATGGADTDGDGVADRAELLAGTDPTRTDTDGDQRGDAAELSAGTDPLQVDVVLANLELDGGQPLLLAGDLSGDSRPDALLGDASGVRVVDIGSGAVLTQLTGLSPSAMAVSGWDSPTSPQGLLLADATADTAWLLPSPLTSSGDPGALATLTLSAEAVGDQLGCAVAGAGDVDDDGADDLIIGACGRSGGGTIYLWTGGSGDHSAADSAATVQGVTGAGQTLSLGDTDGDGVADLAFAGGGQVVVVLGPISGALTATDGDALLSSPTGTRAGSSLDWAGDVDGDGLDDLVVTGTADTGGRAWLLLGPTTGQGLIDRAQGIRVSEDDAPTQSGGVGDLDGDGLSDVLLGMPDADKGAGLAAVVYGPASGVADLLDSDKVLLGASGAALGDALDGGLDVDGDGLSDLLVGAPGLDASLIFTQVVP